MIESNFLNGDRAEIFTKRKKRKICFSFLLFRILKGGCASGFRHVEPEKYTPRLLRFHGLGIANMEAVEVKFTRKAIHSGDVFILDNGLEAFQWNGSTSNKDERVKVSGRGVLGWFLQFVRIF